MTGILAQTIALTAYGNEYLTNAELSQDLYKQNKSFQSCNRVDFIDYKKPILPIFRPKAIVLADEPSQWFKYLKNNGCLKLRLFFEYSTDFTFTTDYKLAGLVGGGGNWLIEALHENYSDYWVSNWKVTRENASDKKIWTVDYERLAKNFRKTNLQIDQTETREMLRKTLAEIKTFAYENKVDDWAKVFEDALNNLDSECPQENCYYSDIIPVQNYSLSSIQILFAASKAWVFGGMGSWNDLNFESRETNDLYESLSRRLYEIVNRAIICAVNSF